MGEGVELVIYSGINGCSTQLRGFDLSIDWIATLGRWPSRYFTTIVCWAIGIVALLVYDAWGAGEDENIRKCCFFSVVIVLTWGLSFRASCQSISPTVWSTKITQTSASVVFGFALAPTRLSVHGHKRRMAIRFHSTHTGLDCFWISVRIMDAAGSDYVANWEDQPSISDKVREILGRYPVD